MIERAKATAKIPEAKKENSSSPTPETDLSQFINSPIGHIMFLQHTIGNQGVQRLFKSGAIQAKLKIVQPNDIYEQEADRIAEQVMHLPEADVQRQVGGKEEALVQPERIAEQITPLIQRQAEEDEKEEEEEPIQTKLKDEKIPNSSPDLQKQISTLRGNGQPLPFSLRDYFEPRFGYNFSLVNVHTDARAAEVARKLSARSFTVGQDIVFETGEYAPGTTEGKKLLAHELTHVVQQTQGLSGRSSKVSSNKIQQESRMNRFSQAEDVKIVEHGRPAGLGQYNLNDLTYVQRLVRKTRVSCPLPGGGMQNPHSSDRRASSLLDNAIKRIDSAVATRATDASHADVVAVGKALRRVFRLNPKKDRTWTEGPPGVRLPVIRRRLEIAKNYIDSVVFRFTCIAAGGSHTIPGCTAGTCNPDTEAFTCPANPTDIVLCPLFWTRNLNQRGRILAHEVFHINFGFIHDWGQPDVHNAHCYAQFAALLNGFNSPVGFRCH